MIKKIFKILSDILLYCFIFLGLITIIITLSSKKDSDGATNIFNYQLRLVITDSMDKCSETNVSKYKIKSIPKNSLVLIKKIKDNDYKKIKEGDVLTFRYLYTEQVTITHRVKSIVEKDTGGYIIELVGDNKTGESELLVQTIDTSIEESPNYIIGEVVYTSIIIGFILNMLKSSLGIVFIIIIPSFIIILLEVIKIINMTIIEKRKLAEKKANEKEQEILELKKKIREIESKGI
ncbi:MAG: hypothetical protein J6K18_05040 [Bacilli bacterium]|nr:hypothetical protein [Bacilli bacterium]